MNIEEYTDTDDPYAPRPRASQEVARAKRERATETDTPVVTAPRPWLLYGVFGSALLMVIALSWQLAQPTKPLVFPTPVPTEAASHTFAAPPTSAPAATTAPTATIAPRITPAPAESLPVGRGLTLEEETTATPEPQAAPSYIENVGAQAPHSPRGGLCGPISGDCAPGVPDGLDNSQYIANVGAQAPHKIR